MGNAVIYRPAYDAEVEYLESTGDQWIDTGVYPNSATSFELKETLTAGRFMFGCWDGDVDNAVAYIITGEASATGTLFYRNAGTTNNMVLNYDCGGLHIYSFRNKKLYVDNVEIGDLPIQTDTERLEHSIYLFNRNANSRPTLEQPTNARIHSFQVTEDGVLIRDFIPVRIGSVGYLYDKVTKQLFANKGTGNFILGNDVSNAIIPQQRCVLYFGSQRSVGFERIYEEYEWLRGDGSAYINTNVGDLSDVDYITCYLSAVDVNTDNRLFGRESSNTYPNTLVGAGFDNPNRRIVLWINNIRLSLAFSTKEGRLHINIVDGIASTDEGLRSFGTLTYLNGRNFYLFGDNGNNKIFSGKIKSFEIDKKINLIPCKLLQPIPAILDGNGIARQAGECGMWDKVSGRFYGNVSESGTFTVKGPKCYEEYKWLRIDVNTMQHTLMMSLPVNSYQFSFRRKWLRQGTYYIHSSYFTVAGYSYFTNQNIKLLIWDRANATNIYDSGTRFNLGDTITINCNAENYNFDEVSMPIYGVCNFIPFDCGVDDKSVGADIAFLTSSITVDGVERYVPCKLTHGIPASMDANGISRPAGTCGMWDKVNDVFYGNVANSGTFTVSND